MGLDWELGGGTVDEDLECCCQIASVFGVYSKGADLIRWSPTGAGVRRAALAVHGLVIIR